MRHRKQPRQPVGGLNTAAATGISPPAFVTEKKSMMVQRPIGLLAPWLMLKAKIDTDTLAVHELDPDIGFVIMAGYGNNSLPTRRQNQIFIRRFLIMMFNDFANQRFTSPDRLIAVCLPKQIRT